MRIYSNEDVLKLVSTFMKKLLLKYKKIKLATHKVSFSNYHY